MRRYLVSTIDYTIQELGLRFGCPSVFVRFGGVQTTEIRALFLTADQILQRITEVAGACCWVVFAGREPAEQLDPDLILRVQAAGYHVAIETDGRIPLPAHIDWITVVPDGPESELLQLTATEVIYRVRYGEMLPRPKIEADHYLINPAAAPDGVPADALRWCIGLVMVNPDWRLCS